MARAVYRTNSVELDIAPALRVGFHVGHAAIIVDGQHIESTDEQLLANRGEPAIGECADETGAKAFYQTGIGRTSRHVGQSRRVGGAPDDSRRCENVRSAAREQREGDAVDRGDVDFAARELIQALGMPRR